MGSSSFEKVVFELLPLSLNQREIWLDCHAWPEEVHLNIGGGAFLIGPLDIRRFEKSLELLVAQNDALRLAPLPDGSQKLLQYFKPELEKVEIGDVTNPRGVMKKWWRERIRHPFTLDGTPPWRFSLLRANDRFHGLCIFFHHLIMDGWGTSLIMREWSRIYNGLESGELPLPSMFNSYRDFIIESNNYRTSKTYATDSEYWKQKIATLPPSLFEKRHPFPRNNKLPSAWLGTHRISRDRYERLKQGAAALGTSPFIFLLSAIFTYFYRITHHRTIVIGIPSLNRKKQLFKATPGTFVSVSVIKVEFINNMATETLIAAVRSAVRGALRHQGYPLSELGKYLQIIRSGRDGIFDVLLSYERQDYSVSFGSAKVTESRQLFTGTARYPLGITICEFDENQDVEMVLEGSERYFDAGEIELLGRRLWFVVEELLANPSTGNVDEIRILPPEEHWALIQGFHQNIASHECTQPFIRLFEHQAVLRPEALALIWDGGSMNYSSLEARSGKLAMKLKSIGAGKDKVIALAMARSADMVVALLAVAKAGAAFLPLDADAPISRLSDILEASNAIVVLTDAESRERFSMLQTRAVVIAYDEMRIIVNSENGPPINAESACPASGDLAYVLFTSGSTGKPKGVMVEHASLSRRLSWLSRAFAVNWRDRSLQVTQMTFDPSLIELILPLIHGASVVLPPGGRLQPDHLVSFACRHEVTMMAFVPSTLIGFIESSVTRSGLKLKVACCGGEVLSPETANRFISETGATLFNVYGPTETSIFATAWKCEFSPADRSLPIGRPIDDTCIYVLDSQLRPLPFGVPGEIYIGGETLARGYLNRPDLDKEVFLIDPFRAGGRMYRTGDRGWLGSDGNLYFIGRMDRQIKLRGYRIELGEIEANCFGVTGITQAAAKLIIHREKPEIHLWTAGSYDLDHLRQSLRARLPDYMIPAGIHMLPSLPVSSTGKIDYDLLFVPNPTALPGKRSRAPATDLERTLVRLWEKVLNCRPIGVHDDFFDLGGDSLVAVKLLAEIEKLTGQKAPLYWITEHPTVSALAASLSRAIEPPDMMIHLNVNRGRIPVYLAVSGHGDLLRFRKLSEHLGSACDFYMLQPPVCDTIHHVSELAKLYADLIGARTEIPGLIAGFSIGGIAALETAGILLQRHQSLQGLLLIDTIFPKAVFGGIASWRVVGWMVRNLYIQDLTLNGRRLGAMFNDPGLATQVKALKGYHPSGFYGSAFLIKSSGLANWDRLFFAPWRRSILKDLTEFEVPGLHGSIFEDGRVAVLAATIQRILEMPPDRGRTP